MSDVRTLPAGPELDLRLAKILGFLDSWNGGHPLTMPYVWVDTMTLQLPDGTRTPWHPSANTGQALDFGGAWLGRINWTWELSRSPSWGEKPYVFSAWEGGYKDDEEQREKYLIVTAEFAAIAFVRGVCLVVEAVKA